MGGGGAGTAADDDFFVLSFGGLVSCSFSEPEDPPYETRAAVRVRFINTTEFKSDSELEEEPAVWVAASGRSGPVTPVALAHSRLGFSGPGDLAILTQEQQPQAAWQCQLYP